MLPSYHFEMSEFFELIGSNIEKQILVSAFNSSLGGYKDAILL